MRCIRTISLVATVFITLSVLFTSAALAADGYGTADVDMSATSMETSSQTNEIVIIKIATPDLIEISAGETVTWWNQQRPKLPVVLVSDDGLWDDQTIYYGRIFSYTFEEPGIYTYSAKDNPAITGTVVVTEKKMPSVVATPAKEIKTVVEPEPVMTEEMGQVNVQTQEQTQVMTTTPSNEFLIIRIVTPSTLEVYEGDTVTWRNLQRPKLPVVLVSDDGLWEDYTIYYGKIFTYTFEELGTYSFSAQDNPAITGTVIVTEKKMPSVAATPVKETTMVVEPEPVMMEEMEQVSVQTQEQTPVMTTTRSNEFLIVRIATPEIIEIDSGEAVTWRNLQRPKLPIVLVSDDGLWDDQTIYYGKIFTYTFEKPGTYAFSVKDNPAIKGTIVVT
ncbi:cupredoxin domain-containing protein [Methanolobus mangrovi]|uniref:Cupredoxin domain-containing protein n=1 Tax=Methanolobus mangrovi TaxID=3072977 RepID=A0AA51UG95_9EURY|nr:cupredoxin domain-containing protein [Methanolobus mangrovi]WMW21146.1 cupredoxin domain-containing protein [Methanolobus mangrovi]